MLITTHVGLVAARDHLACIALKRCGTDREVRTGSQVLPALVRGDIRRSLARQTEGAYFALDAPQSAPTGEGG
jgi:hypothetical protein